MKPETADISVIIPAYNAEKHISRALNSIALQTRVPDEVIVVDDGSSDGTADAVRCWARETGITTKLLCQRNKGAAAARNAGISVAGGRYIAFLDADDSWRPEKLARQAEFMNSHPECDILFSDFEFFDESGASRSYHDTVVSPARGDIFLPLYTTDCFCWSSTVFARRRVFDNSFRFDTRYTVAEDYDLWLRLSLHYRFDYLPDILARYHWVSDSLSRRTATIFIAQASVFRRIADLAGARLSSSVIAKRLRKSYTRAFTSLWQSKCKVGALAYFIRVLTIDGWQLRISLPFSRYVFVTIVRSIIGGRKHTRNK
ncbi:MAG: glycosyltransferase [Planctomycetota bacterium]|nr:MAG: glycosyltransferase [Planctomycetota bacterium]